MTQKRVFPGFKRVIMKEVGFIKWKDTAAPVAIE